jgi:peptidoglycan/xylan/chitin deacetylase (PgdA/CDA1 family)
MFEAHLQLYQQYCNVVSLDQYYAGDFNYEKFNVCITFDDGFANNFKYALPLLEKYQMPAAFFVTAIRDAGYDILWNDFLGIVSYYGPMHLDYQQRQYSKNKDGRYTERGTGKTLVEYLKEERFDAKAEMMNNLRQLFPEKPDEEEYWKQMTPDEIRELSRSQFVTIGSHGYYHNRMDKLSLDDMSKEMADSKNYLQHLIDREIKAFAFPYGNYSRDMVEEAKKLGFTQLLAMDFFYPEDKDDDSMRERFTVNPFLSANNQMYATIAARYE